MSIDLHATLKSFSRKITNLSTMSMNNNPMSIDLHTTLRTFSRKKTTLYNEHPFTCNVKNSAREREHISPQ